MKNVVSHLAAFALFTTVSAYGSTLSTSVTCTDTATQSTITQTNSCSTGLSGATATLGYSTTAGILTVDAKATASANSPIIGLQQFSGSANASGMFDLTFTTTGPVREGFLETDNVTCGYEGGAGFSYTLQDASNETLADVGCVGNSANGGSAPGVFCPNGGRWPSYVNPLTIPVTLGTTFALIASDSAGASTANIPVGNSAGASFDTTFQFFEADGTTQATAIIPEPGMSALMLTGLAIFFIGVRRNQQKN